VLHLIQRRRIGEIAQVKVVRRGQAPPRQRSFHGRLKVDPAKARVGPSAAVDAPESRGAGIHPRSAERERTHGACIVQPRVPRFRGAEPVHSQFVKHARAILREPVLDRSRAREDARRLVWATGDGRGLDRELECHRSGRLRKDRTGQPGEQRDCSEDAERVGVNGTHGAFLRSVVPPADGRRHSPLLTALRDGHPSDRCRHTLPCPDRHPRRDPSPDPHRDPCRLRAGPDGLFRRVALAPAPARAPASQAYRPGIGRRCHRRLRR
jgi:hypothetical protein